MKVLKFKQYNLKRGRQPNAMLPSALTSLVGVPRLIQPVIAGGAIRDVVFGNVPSDYDMFFVGRTGQFTDMDSALESLKQGLTTLGVRKTFQCPEGALISYDLNGTKIQIINRRGQPYSSVFDLFDSFDFHACQFAFYGNDIYTTKEAVRSVRKKNLTLHKITYPSATVNRLYKYRRKGYYVGNCIQDIVHTLGTMPPEIFDSEFIDDSLYID